jgi:hypothetical protein
MTNINVGIFGRPGRVISDNGSQVTWALDKVGSAFLLDYNDLEMILFDADKRRAVLTGRKLSCDWDDKINYIAFDIEMHGAWIDEPNWDDNIRNALAIGLGPLIDA